ncbi:MAG: MotA/TolQ/ExbB proton channel family protein [Myxococcota bacterium]
MSFGTFLQQGGWAMWPIYACSLAALTVFIKKMVDLASSRLGDVSWFEKALQALRNADDDELHRVLRGAPHPAARVLDAGLSVRRASPDRIEAEARRVGNLEIQRAEAYLSVLSFIAQAAPLLGLLGTVLGMVDLFRGLQSSGLQSIDLALLSSGIWKALLTTAAGLTVALPTLAAYSYLVRRADSLRIQVSDLVQRMLTELSVMKPEDNRPR